MDVWAKDLRFLDIVVRNGERCVILDDPRLVDATNCYVAPTYNQDTTQFNPTDEFAQEAKLNIVRTITPRPKPDSGLSK